MNWRVCGIEVRRSVALWLGGLFLLAFLVMEWLLSPLLFRGGGAWNLQWIGLAIQPRHLLAFVWPFVVGIGALQGRRDKGSGAGELLASTSRPAWQRAAYLAGVVAAGITAGYLVVTAIGAVQVAGNTSYFTFDWVPIAAATLLSLVAGVWLGMGIGRLLPSMLTPPILTLACLMGLVVVEIQGGTAALLAPNRTRDRDVRAYDTLLTGVTVGQLVWFASLAAAGLVLVIAVRKRTVLAAALPVAVGAAVALPLFPNDEAPALVADREAAELVCAEGTPEVCLARANRGQLDAVTSAAREALDRLARLPNAPDSVREVVADPAESTPDLRSGESVPADVIPVSFDLHTPSSVLLSRDAAPEHNRLALLHGAGTPACAKIGRGSDRTEIACIVAGAWLSGKLHLTQPPEEISAAVKQRQSEVNARAKRVWRSFRELPEAEQRRRVAEFREAALRDEDNLLSILTGDGQR